MNMRSKFHQNRVGRSILSFTLDWQATNPLGWTFLTLNGKGFSFVKISTWWWANFFRVSEAFVDDAVEALLLCGLANITAKDRKEKWQHKRNTWAGRETNYFTSKSNSLVLASYVISCILKETEVAQPFTHST